MNSGLYYRILVALWTLFTLVNLAALLLSI